MKRTVLIAILTAGFATAAAAGPGCSGKHDQQAMTCADGAVWDTQSQSCVPLTTS